MEYKEISIEDYYRKGVYRHFTEDCKCSTSITSRLDVSALVAWSKATNTKFYINVLYLLCRVLNSRDDYKMQYLYKENKLVVFDKINPTHYIFHDDTETCSVVYTEYSEDYQNFYDNCTKDIDRAKSTREYGLDHNHPNYFDASYISWLSYDSLNIELPDGHLYYMPIVNWGRYREENGKLMMPVTVRLNHAVADGYLVAKVFSLLEKEMMTLTDRR